MAEPPGTSRSPQQLETELHFLIARFLSNGPYHKSAEVLIQQMNESKVLPKRLDWLGNEHGRSFEEMVSANKHVSSDHLLKICQHLGSLLGNIIPCNVQTGSLLGAGKQSLLRTEKGCKNVQWNRQMLAALHRGRPPEMPINIRFPPNVAEVHYGKHLSGALSITSGFPVQLYQRMNMHRRILGHRSSVYCVAFDRTGHRIFTGADDGLVKIWSAHDGRLLATLRGHSAEVSELSVNYENTLIAAASCEKIIRVWSLRTCAPVAVLQGHTISVTSLLFSPLINGSVRYLISTGGDSTVCCWEWDVDTLHFKDRPIKFIEKSGPGAQMLCCSCSAGGMYLATGGSDHAIRLYFFGCEAPKKLIQLEAHADIIDSVQFANSGERFVSGSNDGTARIWYLYQKDWKSIRLDMREGDKDSEEEEEQLMRPKVLMITWDLTDTIVVTASNLHSLKVWESHTGKLLRVLSGHQNDIYVLEPHPFDSRVMISAGYDGKIIIWDVAKGNQIKCYCNTIEHEGHGAILDCKLSGDGQHIASTDSHGHLIIFGYGCSKPYEKIPDEMFFHTDYRPLCIDGNHYVLDEQTQLAPHLMPPPFLVDGDGNPHEPKYQRLVPGRENFEDEHLIPQLGYMETSDGEIVEQVIGQQASNDLQNAEPNSRDGIRPPQIADGQRREDTSSPPSIVASHNGQVQGVRQLQSTSPQSQTSAERDYLAWRRRVVVPEIDCSVYRQQEESRLERAREERAYFLKQILQLSFQENHFTTEKQNVRSNKRPKCRSPSPRPDVEQFLDLSCEEGEETESRGSEEEISTVDDTTSHVSTDKEEDWRSEESSEYSDWTVDAGINLQPPSRISTRRPLKTIITSSEEEEEEMESSAEESSSPPKKRIPKRRHSNSQVQSPGRPLSDRENLTDFHPPLWITDTTPRRSPFVPQMGDDVIYFRQGHEAYINVVRRNNLDILKKLKEPWKHNMLRDQELVKIVGIRYDVGPPTLCCLKLALIDHVTGRFTEQSFSLKYHDMPDVIDFLVLKQFYDQSCQTDWHAGDRFRSIIDDAWWFGTVMDQEPYHSDYPDSLFQCYTVKWDNTEIERLSPWDMEIIPAYVSPPSELGTSISLNSDELEELLYSPQKGEWGDGDRDTECERIICGIDQILSMEIATQFAAPVDLNVYPTYCTVVSYPTDLSTIRTRLVNRFYRRLSALIWEVRYIELNARAFNEPDSSIAKSAKMITDLLLPFIMDSRRRSISTLCNNAEGDEEEAAEEQKQNRRDNVAKSTEDAWRIQCMELANAVLEHEDSEPFREPVDLYDYPDYQDIIESPRDFGTITEYLESRGYSSPLELRKDMRLVFSNAKMYTPDKKSKIYNMALRLSEFVEARMDTIISDYKAACNCKQKENELNSLKSNTTNNKKQRRLISESENESGQEPCSSRSTSSEVFSNNSRDSIASTSGTSSHRDVLGKSTASAAKSAPVKDSSSSSSTSDSSESESDSSSSTSDSEHSSGSEEVESNKKSASNSHAGKVNAFVKSVDPAKRNVRTATVKLQKESQVNHQQRMTSSKRRHSSDSEESVPNYKGYSKSTTQKKMPRKSAALAANKIKCMSDIEGNTCSSDAESREGKGSRTLPQRAAAAEAKKHLLDGSGEENALRSDTDQQTRMEPKICTSKSVRRIKSDSSGSESGSKYLSAHESSLSYESEDEQPINGKNSDTQMSESSIADSPCKRSTTVSRRLVSESDISSGEVKCPVTKKKHPVPNTKITAEKITASKKDKMKKDLPNSRKTSKKYANKVNERAFDSTDSDSDDGSDVKRKVRKKVASSLSSPPRKTKVVSDSEETLDSEAYDKDFGSDEELPRSKSINRTESSSESSSPCSDSSSSCSDSESSFSDSSSNHNRKINGKTDAVKHREPEYKRKRTKSSCDDDWEELNYKQRKKLTRQAKIPTRNRGKRTVEYDDTDSDGAVSRRKSTNRRLRKASARARARQFLL